jgi:hypothetical protein
MQDFIDTAIGKVMARSVAPNTQLRLLFQYFFNIIDKILNACEVATRLLLILANEKTN